MGNAVHTVWRGARRRPSAARSEQRLGRVRARRPKLPDLERLFLDVAGRRSGHRPVTLVITAAGGPETHANPPERYDPLQLSTVKPAEALERGRDQGLEGP